MTSLPLPPTTLRFMQEDDERLIRQGSELAETLYAVGLGDGDRLLDVGCGYGRLALGLMSTGYRGRYLGFDILAPQVKWCRKNLSARDKRYRFRHVDVHNARYNPQGTMDAAELTFPTPDASKEFCSLFSVLTHLYEADIRQYLAEIRRVLVPGGKAVTTWLLFDRERLSAVTSAKSAYPLTYRISEDVRFSDPNDPLRAIGYHVSLMRTMVDDAGLRISRVEFGTWAGEPGMGFQDLVVLERPLTLRNRLGRTRRRVLHALRDRRRPRR